MRLSSLAWIAFGTHVAAALGSLFFLRPGTPVGPDAAARMSHVATHLAEWRLGWLAWTLASLSLVALLFALHRKAAWLAFAALFVDLPSQLALAWPAWSLERAAYVGTGVVANGVYTVALGWAAFAALPRRLALACVPALVAGAAVTVASALFHPTLLFLATGALTALMIGWLVLLGVRASGASSS